MINGLALHRSNGLGCGCGDKIMTPIRRRQTVRPSAKTLTETTAFSRRSAGLRFARGCKIICVNGILRKTFKGQQSAYQQRTY
ncbi:hypothetical protein SODG_003103 [Sodalis praecaptivus]|nr:hypothetical protein NVIRENTERO_04085 [Sodalis praecaptivus]